MDARHALLEQQFYATVQRQKTPALTPFSSGGYEVDTIEQLKRAVRSQARFKKKSARIVFSSVDSTSLIRFEF